MERGVNECVIEWVRGDSLAGVTMPSNTRLKGRILKLAETHDEVKYEVNQDGSIYATVPIQWVKISPPRALTDEQKAEMGKRLSEANAQRKVKLDRSE